MPHQCTNCGRTFPDGSKEMLSGCPDCGGNKFQFRPPGSLEDPEPSDDATAQDARRSTDAADSETSEAISSPKDGPDPDADAQVDDHEDRAQADARSEVVTPDELAVASEDVDGETPSDTDGAAVDPESDERPGLDELREELNDQFESIKIVNPGQYELNLMELYDRDEYIISLREDGRYIIEVPETWHGGLDDDE